MEAANTNVVPYHKGLKRSRLVDTAMKILEEEGLEKLSVRELARRSNIAPSAVYNHFKSREDIYAALAVRGFENFRDFQTEIRKATRANTEHVARYLSRSYARFAVESPDLYRLMFGNYIIGRHRYPDLDIKGMEAFGATFDIIMGPGHFDDRNPTFDYPETMTLWVAMHGLIMVLIDGHIPVELNDQPMIETIVDRIVDTLHSGIKYPQGN